MPFMIYSPDIEPKYQKFKSITLDMCEFTYEAGHKAISQWLNQDVEVELQCQNLTAKGRHNEVLQ